MATEKLKRYLENLIALILISIVVLVFFVQINKMSVIVEREAVQQTLSTVRLGMQFYTMKTLVSGDRPDMRKFAGINPFGMLQQSPINYAGEFSAEESAGVSAGQWYYDKSAGQLVYRISHYPLYEGDNRRELRYRLNAPDVASDVFGLRLIEVKEET